MAFEKINLFIDQLMIHSKATIGSSTALSISVDFYNTILLIPKFKEQKRYFESELEKINPKYLEAIKTKPKKNVKSNSHQLFNNPEGS